MSTPGTDAVMTKEGRITGYYDFSLTDDGDILTEDFFDTAILMSFFCERRAASSEIPDSQRRRGWIGNESTPGFDIGSKIWLYEQARIDRNTLNGINDAANASLQWMIDDAIAVSVRSSSTFTDDNINLEVVITRPNSKVEKRYFTLWENTGS